MVHGARALERRRLIDRAPLDSRHRIAVTQRGTHGAAAVRSCAARRACHCRPTKRRLRDTWRGPVDRPVERRPAPRSCRGLDTDLRNRAPAVTASLVAGAAQRQLAQTQQVTTTHSLVQDLMLLLMPLAAPSPEQSPAQSSSIAVALGLPRRR
ncbi:hypothetical protein ON010_g17853 [Phytophthora cinnamomi]|nr:hypothetical protein ON010_g17853 [Phytophthora cinnamomi]